MKPIQNLAPFELSAVDKKVLSMRDEDFKPHTWDDAKKIVENNQLDKLRRRPSELVAYISWSRRTTSETGSVTKYMLKRRLRWEHDEDGNLTSSAVDSTPFANSKDFSILKNNWPYTFESGITHLVIWLKTPLAVKEAGGDLTDEARELVASFVQKTFVEPLKKELGEKEAEDRVLWFKNRTKLQTVSKLEHIHVLIRGASKEMLDGWIHPVQRQHDDEMKAENSTAQ